RVFDAFSGKTVGLFPGRETVAIMRRRKHLDESGHLRLEFSLARTGAAGSHAAERAAVITEIAADHFVLSRVPRLLEILPDEFQRSLDGFRTAAESLDKFQLAGRDAADFFDEVQRHVGDSVQRRCECDA